jgi:hypothetical protein
MSQASKVALFLLVFFFGCAAERLVVPPARAGGPTTRWEYRCKEESGEKYVAEMANAFGAEGWEMAGVGRTGTMATSDNVWCFKRTLP